MHHDYHKVNLFIHINLIYLKVTASPLGVDFLLSWGDNLLRVNRREFPYQRSQETLNHASAVCLTSFCRGI